MIGHEKLKTLFKKLSAENKIQNSIFFGEEKIGKNIFALSLANYLEKGLLEEPGSVLSDLILIGGDGQSLGVDVVRQIKEFLSEKPFFSPYRLALINDAQLLTTEAQNALLKISEESAASSRIILVTRDFELLLPTLSSRFQKFYFNNLSKKEMVKFLKLRFNLVGEKAETLIKKTFGQPGRAAELLADKRSAASDLIRASSLRRKALIKELVAGDDFDLRNFLGDLIADLSTDTSKNYYLIKKTLKLYRQSEFNLNPRLQLENLLLEMYN
ncbi:MAG: hypothetical protein M1334_03400 [Patescibacteria group bacterium]|nr:hypothetical protein [Patescibacteria group bacterium]